MPVQRLCGRGYIWTQPCAKHPLARLVPAANPPSPDQLAPRPLSEKCTFLGDCIAGLAGCIIRMARDGDVSQASFSKPETCPSASLDRLQTNMRCLRSSAMQSWYAKEHYRNHDVRPERVAVPHLVRVLSVRRASGRYECIGPNAPDCHGAHGQLEPQVSTNRW